MNAIAPLSRPMYIMLKSAGSLCNLRYKYCYYLEKSKLYDDNKDHAIADALLEKLIEEYIGAQTTSQVLFTRHGGETLVRSISFCRRALELRRHYACGCQIDSSIQTNSVLLNGGWCRFFKKNNFLVGVSIDDPQEFHDEYRRNAMGKPPLHQVMKGIDLLDKYGVEWNTFAVVNGFDADYPLDLYHLFKEIDCRYIQLTPIIERIIRRTDRLALASGMQEGGKLADFPVTAEQWGNFLCIIFDEWVRHDVGEYYIQLFDATLASWVGTPSGARTVAKECGHAGVTEYNGDVHSCDHSAYPEHKPGNLLQHTIYEMMNNDRQRDFSRMKYRPLPQQCKEYKYQFTCYGECPKNRPTRSYYGNLGLSYLCKGYYQFFEHVAPHINFMKNEPENQRPPANVTNQVFGK